MGNGAQNLLVRLGVDGKCTRVHFATNERIPSIEGFRVEAVQSILKQ